MLDPIGQKILSNNQEIERCRKVCDIINTDGFKIYLAWLEEHHKEWESVPVHAIKDNDHLRKLQGGVMYGNEINAQLQYFEQKAKEEQKETPKS